jgi:hypothetical protein
VCAGTDPVTCAQRCEGRDRDRQRGDRGLAIAGVACGAALGFMHAIGGAAFGPSIIDGRRCDPETVDFVRRWRISGIVPPNCR